MTDAAQSIELNLESKLQDAAYRQKFFLAETSAQIASQIIALRKRRGLNQKEVAELLGTRQPAISRVEQADYQNWSFNTLRSIADALDARIRVYIQPAEDILGEYKSSDAETELDAAERDALDRLLRDERSTQSRKQNEEISAKLQDQPATPAMRQTETDASASQDLQRLRKFSWVEQHNSARLSDEGRAEKWK